MYFKNLLNNYNNKTINIYVDMDGVVADYDALEFMKEKDKDDVYLNKRPIFSVIKILKELSEYNNVNLHILSCTTRINQKDGKYKWLNKYMDFIKNENINIISREEKNYLKAAIIKTNFLKDNIDKKSINIMIDDSHDVISEIIKSNIAVTPLHITSILD